jgi:hypothetical protein
MVGSVLQHTRSFGEEETVEVVRNHEGGTRSGGGRPFPTEATTLSPGVDSLERLPDERAFFEGNAGRCGEAARKGWLGVVAGNRARRLDEAAPGAARQGQEWWGRRLERGATCPHEGPRTAGTSTLVDSPKLGGPQEEPDSATSCG